MLHAAHQQGVAHALAHFNIKSAGFVDSLRQMMIGDAGKHFIQGLGAFKKGQPLHYKNVLWPAVTKDKGGHWLNWLTRANTAMLPLSAYQAYKNAPEGKPVSATLGVLGDAVGSTYGLSGFGQLGAPLAAGVLGRAGRALGGLVEG